MLCRARMAAEETERSAHVLPVDLGGAMYRPLTGTRHVDQEKMYQHFLEVWGGSIPISTHTHHMHK